MTDDLNFVLKARREKLDALKAAGINPFAYSYDASTPPQKRSRSCRPAADAWS